MLGEVVVSYMMSVFLGKTLIFKSSRVDMTVDFIDTTSVMEIQFDSPTSNPFSMLALMVRADIAHFLKSKKEITRSEKLTKQEFR